MKIGSHTIASIDAHSSSCPPFVIAEIGVNHDGCPTRALELIRSAHSAGADAVKFQFFTPEHLLSTEAKLAEYQRNAGERDPMDMLRRLQLPLDALESCCSLASSLSIEPLVSVFSLEDADAVLSLPWSGLKVASPDLINKPLLERLSSDGRPLLVSTGAATLDEVVRTGKWIESCLDRVCMMQCVSSYPVPRGSDSLDGMHAIAHAIPRLSAIGYSDHTPEIGTGAQAVTRGAAVLEKHFTDDTARLGPDHAASLDHEGLCAYVQAAKAQPIGDVFSKRGKKSILACEGDVRRFSRQSVVYTRDLRPGHTLTREDLTIRRPGLGMEPEALTSMIGLIVTKQVDANTLALPDHFRTLQDSAA